MCVDHLLKLIRYNSIGGTEEEILGASTGKVQTTRFKLTEKRRTDHESADSTLKSSKLYVPTWAR